MSYRRYYFHVIGDGHTFTDDKGTELASPEVAKLQAVVIAAELAREGNDYHGFLVCAEDDDGNEIARVPVVTSVDDATC